MSTDKEGSTWKTPEGRAAKMTDVDEVRALLGEYEQFLSGKAEGTVDAYLRTVRHLIGWVAQLPESLGQFQPQQLTQMAHDGRYRPVLNGVATKHAFQRLHHSRTRAGDGRRREFAHSHNDSIHRSRSGRSPICGGGTHHGRLYRRGGTFPSISCPILV